MTFQTADDNSLIDSSIEDEAGSASSSERSGDAFKNVEISESSSIASSGVIVDDGDEGSGGSGSISGG